MARAVCPLTTVSQCHYHRANLVWATGLFINDATGQLPQMKCAISINTIGWRTRHKGCRVRHKRRVRVLRRTSRSKNSRQSPP